MTDAVSKTKLKRPDPEHISQNCQRSPRFEEAANHGRRLLGVIGFLPVFV